MAAPLSAEDCRLAALSPAQPPLLVEEGEKSIESQTFQTAILAVSPSGVVHIFDAAYRIRQLAPDGRLYTVAGNGSRADAVTPGPALGNGLPSIGQILFSRQGVLHFTAAGQVYRLLQGVIEPVAGSGIPGFNGEEGPALSINFGSITHAAFAFDDSLLIIDGYGRVRRLDADGFVRTVAGSTRPASSAGLTGDRGPATSASLSSPRQVVPFPDGSFWIKDYSGRHIRLVNPQGIITTVNQAFEPSVTILQWPDGAPAAASSNRVYPIRSNGQIETGTSPFAPFTGTPRAIGPDGALYFEGSTRPDQRFPLIRLSGAAQAVLAGAPVAPIIDGQAPPFGAWNPRTGAVLYASASGGKNGILAASPGQPPRFVVGGGADIGDAAGKSATDLAIFGIVAFTVDSSGRIYVADVNRRRILVVDPSSRVSILKDDRGQEIVYAPLGSFSSLQRIVADSEGNLFWFQSGATPTGGVFTADIAAWNRSSGAVATYTVSGLYALARLDDGSAAVVLGNGSNFRSAFRLTLAGLGDPIPGFSLLPYASITRWQEAPAFVAAGRLFLGTPGALQVLDLPFLPSGTAFTPDYILLAEGRLVVHLADGGFYRFENPAACRWLPQPSISPGGVLNAASLTYPDAISPRQLITVIGSGLGPQGGRGFNLDGTLRATGQAAPYPALILGNFSGAIPQSTLSGTTLPVLYSDDSVATYQAVATIPSSGSYLLYFSWMGLQLIYPNPIAIVPATPALFTREGQDEPRLALAFNEDGSPNGPLNPAQPGSLLRLSATGLGALTDNLSTGDFCPPNPIPLAASPQVTIGGLPVAVEFAGCAAGTILGHYQVLVRLPEDVEPGLLPVSLTVGEASAPSTPAVAVAAR